MRYKYDIFMTNDPVLGTQLMILENIKRQKRLVNDGGEYSEDEKRLIMKGLDLAFDRAWAVLYEEDHLDRSN